ncbi:MAG: TIGR04282 family arsenosugar biosynthesis glycosyltransferase [Proteobacteria bacterium]|nr:TIGR04282 family arsenosugar biosynthesis glycosyltransferase [Pseudomonadota bacterium]
MKSLRTVIFAKALQPGHVKTRLIPALGVEGATALARRLLEHAIVQVLRAQIGTVELCATPADAQAWREIDIPAGVERTDQGPGDLGARLARASKRVIDDGSAVLLVGTDCPALDAAYLRRLAEALLEVDVVMAPAADGGYAALGLNRYDPHLFSDIPWSTGAVARETLRRIEQMQWSVRELPVLHDIDEPADLQWLPADWPEAPSQGSDRGSSLDRSSVDLPALRSIP